MDGCIVEGNDECVSAQHAELPLAAPQPDPLCLRLTFEASSLRRAAAVAAQLRLIMGKPAQIHPTEPLCASAPPPTSSPTWRVELTTPEMPLSLAAIHMWERKLLSLEYRVPGCRFLGWTTDRIPEMSARRSAATAERAPASGAPSRTQRELVAESLLRRPSVRQLGIVHGRSFLR